MECGKHDILPVAGAILDHARVPVMLPRQSDADMRRDGSTTAQTVPIPPSMSAEECTAHQDSRAGPGSTRWCSGGRPVSQNSASSDTVENRRRRWPRRERDPRLRGQDKRPHIAARNGRLFSMAWKPIRQCAPPSVNVCDGRKGRSLIENSMG